MPEAATKFEATVHTELSLLKLVFNDSGKMPLNNDVKLFYLSFPKYFEKEILLEMRFFWIFKMKFSRMQYI